jgi:hypothetical protein
LKGKGTARKEHRIADAYYLAEYRKTKHDDKIMFTLIDSTRKINLYYKIELNKKNKTGLVKITDPRGEQIYEIESEIEYRPLQNISRHFMERINEVSGAVILTKSLISETEQFLYNYILWSYFA